MKAEPVSGTAVIGLLALDERDKVKSAVFKLDCVTLTTCLTTPRLTTLLVPDIAEQIFISLPKVTLLPL